MAGFSCVRCGSVCPSLQALLIGAQNSLQYLGFRGMVGSLVASDETQHNWSKAMKEASHGQFFGGVRNQDLEHM